MLKPSVDFSVSVKGEISGRDYTGLFTARTALSFKARLREDEIYRITLGANPGDASPFAQSVAQAFSYLAVRITESPTFWKESQGGLELVGDDNVLVEVNKACVTAIDEAYKAFREEGQSAKVELQKNEPQSA
jgi:hypothetical protein